jgi:hypothetical protein
MGWDCGVELIHRDTERKEPKERHCTDTGLSQPIRIVGIPHFPDHPHFFSLALSLFAEEAFWLRYARIQQPLRISDGVMGDNVRAE